MDLYLQDQVVIVTGGASGIGRAIVEAFANEGAHVAIWDVAAHTKETAKHFGERFGRNIRGCEVDVTSQGAIRDALLQVVDQLGPVDHLVHAAAVGSGMIGFPFTNLEPNDWPRVLEINIMGMVNVAHIVTPSMVERESGSMVFIASVAGQIGSPTDPPYSAAKAANINFAQCMAKDLATHGIRVNTVCPGMVMTALNESVWRAWNDRQAPESRLSYQAWGDEKVKNVVPLGQWQQPEDVANMVVFLCSDRAAQVTGQTINVDGGIVMHC